jgi:hypothetical protein
MLEVLDDDEPAAELVKMELVVDDRDVEDVLLGVLLVGEDIPPVELTTGEESGRIEAPLLELDLELEALVEEDDSNNEVVVEVLLDMLDTTNGSENIEETDELSWPGPMILVGLETTTSVELELVETPAWSELVLDMLLLMPGEFELELEVEVVLLPT